MFSPFDERTNSRQFSYFDLSKMNEKLVTAINNGLWCVSRHFIKQSSKAYDFCLNFSLKILFQMHSSLRGLNDNAGKFSDNINYNRIFAQY
jgi:hypothetical protein